MKRIWGAAAESRNGNGKGGDLLVDGPSAGELGGLMVVNGG